MSSKKQAADLTLQRLKAIQGVERHVAKLLGSMEDLKDLNEEGEKRIENERAAAQAALDADLLKITSERKSKMLDLELELKEAKRENALKILEKTNEEAILVSKREALEARVKELEEAQAKVAAEAEERTRKALQMKHAMELERSKLTYEKDNAALTEHNKAIESQIEQKDEIIAQMREDAIKMQELVQGVAEASNRPMYMPPQAK